MDRLKVRALAFVIATALPFCAVSGEEPLANCTYKTGVRMPPDECVLFQKAEAERERRAAQQAAQLEENRRIEAEYNRAREAEQARQLEAHKLRQQQEADEIAQRQAAYERQRQQEAREETARERARSNEVASRKKVCGDDYMQPSIGMTVERARQCLGAIQVTGQINRVDGVVTSYTGKGIYLHVMKGQVIAWGRSPS